jgi:hypothetical protein
MKAACTLSLLLASLAVASSAHADDAPPTSPREAIEVDHVDAHPAHPRVHTAGLALMGVGVVGLVAGDLMSDVFLGFELAHAVGGSTPPPVAHQMIVPGLVIAGVGLASLLTGGGMYFATEPPAHAMPPAAPARPDVVQVRLPAWREARLAGPVLPDAVGMSLLTVRFN